MPRSSLGDVLLGSFLGAGLASGALLEAVIDSAAWFLASVRRELPKVYCPRGSGTESTYIARCKVRIEEGPTDERARLQ